MKFFLRIFLFLALSLSALHADEFRDISSVSLKKDEVKKILVKYGSVSKLFKFRWTLYKNDGLIIHRSYDRVVAQNILYLRYKNESFRVVLKPKGADYYKVPYLLVQFKKFDFEKNEAIFELLLSDKSMSVNLKHLNNN
ncbi:hypothetical protein [Sulfurimonas sp.]|uniref:hypothetical protein n=1 Tax=Sulfurimonas sp. TaxID=2022749 RepID=UPI002AB2858F|nr:hypothetical protein [Sulfurimonas sp.]